MKNVKKIICCLTVLSGALTVPTVSFSQDSSALMDLAQQRELTPDDIIAAAKTYPSKGKDDEFLCVNSGGQAGSAIIYGVPSMRIYKYVATAAHDPASGFLHDEETKSMVRAGRIVSSQVLSWADTHHPSFSETNGDYDGRYVFLNDKANPRIFTIDLRDFETKEVIQNPIFNSAHGGAFVTPNTEYIVEGAQYAAPPDRKYIPLTQENFNNHYRGGITFHKFDNTKGRFDRENSFTVIAPPYTQDLSDAGKGESYGYSFTNSFCSERHIGTGPDGKAPPFESGCSANDTDFMHIVHWKKAAELVANGKFETINGHKVIPLEMAAQEGVLFLVPEPKSPHGNDISPDGRYIIVSGKLDTHATVFDIRKIKELIEKKDYAGTDAYGVPILDMQKAMHGQVQLGLGPLHTQYDKEPGVVYTSLYLDSQVVKWNYLDKKVLDKVSINYNIGHLVSMQGDSIDPRGRYVVSLNKLAIDRFESVGPLLPQNHQLIDTRNPKMKVIYDLPLPLGEPHYTVCIDSKKIAPLKVYPEGTDVINMSKSAFATAKGKERVAKNGSRVDVYATINESEFTPKTIDVTQGDEIYLHVTNLSQTEGETYHVTINGLGVLGAVQPGRTATLRKVASQQGQFNIKLTNLASPLSSNLPTTAKLTVAGSGDFERRRLRALELRKQYLTALYQEPDVTQTSSASLHPGEKLFKEHYACSACHALGESKTAPDLTGITKREGKGKDWVRKFVSNPENFYDDPTIAPLVEKYGVKMPNLAVTPEDLEAIIEWLDQFEEKK